MNPMQIINRTNTQVIGYFQSPVNHYWEVVGFPLLFFSPCPSPRIMQTSVEIINEVFDSILGTDLGGSFSLNQ